MLEQKYVMDFVEENAIILSKINEGRNEEEKNPLR